MIFMQNKKKKLAIIGASYLQLPLIQKAKDMNLETHVFAWKCGDIGEKEADYFYPISIIEKDIILEKCKELNISGIISIASDLAMSTVNYIADEMGLIGNSLQCTEKSTNKALMRQAFKIGGDPIPRFHCVQNFTELSQIDIKYPVIIKPTDRSGSRGITKLVNGDKLKNAYDAAVEASFNGNILVEEFIEGQEYSMECISYKGKHAFLAATKKHTTGAPTFIETGHEEPSGLNFDDLEKIQRIIFHALDTLDIKNGASHSEFKINSEGKVYIIEIGGRMGGDCIGSHLVRYSTGFDFVQMVIDVALGNEPDLSIKQKGCPVEIRYLLNQSDIEELSNIDHSIILDKSEIDFSKLGVVTDSSNRLGYYIFKK